jgi:hypothetical protein
MPGKARPANIVVAPRAFMNRERRRDCIFIPKTPLDETSSLSISAFRHAHLLRRTMNAGTFLAFVLAKAKSLRDREHACSPADCARAQHCLTI